jgi:hypothetical protein
MNALSSLQAVLCCIVLCYAARRTVRYMEMSYCVGFLSGFSNGPFNIISVVISIQYYSIVVGLILMPGIGAKNVRIPAVNCFGEECHWIHNNR